MKYFVTLGERTVEVELDGDAVTVEGRRVEARLEQVPGSPEVRIVIDGVATIVAVDAHQGSDLRLVDRGAVREIIVEDERTRHIRLLAGAAKVGSGHAILKAPMPGLVLRILVAVGDRVAVGAPLLSLEAMKMENELRATAAGVVAAVHVVPGEAVEKGQVLLELTPG